MDTTISIIDTPSHLMAGVVSMYQGIRVPAPADKSRGDVRVHPRLDVFPAGDPHKSVRWPFLDPLI
ncbi:hypothetical protein GCM10009854_05190 [Saccharopolyspora halophila]|uniref:Uncharacterized protein n=1 Tax=Saccharopolyspora halophila TaxID=405551 RepID=A0ABP5SMQ0_9PSEU